MSKILLSLLLCTMGLVAEDQIQREAPMHRVGDGFYVHNYFSSQTPGIQNYSPFLLLDYNAPYYFEPSPGYLKGVGGHPHRGFETVTIVYEGALAHRDSTGAGGVIRNGDVQWMTAASGILHEEFHEKQFSDKGGTLHAVQLWVNLPAKDKMSPPKYQTLLKQNIPTIDLAKGTLRVIAGEYLGVKGAATTFTPINVFDLRLSDGANLSLDIPPNHNALLLVTQGALTVNDSEVHFKDFVKLGGDKIAIKTNEESMVLILTGAPIQEPIAGDGPFVMNSRQELRQAYKDFNAGKFGKLD